VSGARRLGAVALLALAGLAAYTYRPPPRLDTGRASRAYEVRILRDTWGVPHVFGKTDPDVAYGLAYAHAEDDFDTIQGALAAARGQLATLIGKDGAPNDYMVALLRVRETVAAHYETDVSPDVRALCQAYAEGINRFAALHPERAAARLYPLSGADVAAGFVHKLPLFFGVDAALKELFEPERARRVSRKGEPTRAAGLVTPEVFGSNTFVVGPKRSADGFTRLAINSHQPWEGPVAWYEAHLHSEDGWDMVGGVFPGAPLVLHGHNRRLGWAHTVNHPDLVDVYVLETDPANPDRYRIDGTWRDLEIRQVPIEVKLFGPFSWTVHRKVAWSVHGPVVRRPHGTYAIRYAGMGEVRHVEQWYRMNRARNLDEWLAAMGMLALPMFNSGYADADGHIAYLYNAKLPLRAEGYDWSAYLPGDTSETLWTQTLPFDQLPRVVDPPSGFLQNCNSTPYWATDGPGNPVALPASFGIETRMTNRALRALELYGGDPSITREEFEAYKFDVTYAHDSQVAARLRALLAAPEPADPILKEAVAVLRGWDLQARADSPQAALAILALQPDDRNDAAPRDLASLQDQVREAALSLKRHFGRLDLPWRDVQRLRRGPLDLGVGGAPDVLRAVYARPQEDGRLLGHAGDSYILMVEWDSQGIVRSRSIHQYGSATKDAASPHFADQAPLFVEGRLKPVWMDEAEIRAHLEREYRPGEVR
jgi:penicillin amidase/acyl-homoserine-lactone acylase